jgi:iron(III) transport system substrate-binding protein
MLRDCAKPLAQPAISATVSGTMTKKLALVFLVVVALALSSCGGGQGDPANAPGLASGDPRIADLYRAALQEGQVTLYSHVTATEEISAFVDAFKKEFPGIEVQVTNKIGSAILTTYLSEKRAGKDVADVIQYPGLEPFQNEFRTEGLVQEYTPSTAAKYPAEASVPGIAYPWLAYTTGAAYNSDKITPRELELLRTYQGWADPSWKGRIDAGSPGSASLQHAVFYWTQVDQQLGRHWFEAFAANRPVAFVSPTPAVERVIAGEFVASYPSLSAVAARAMDNGAPIGWATQEYAVTVPGLVGLASRAPHPNAAKLMVEFTLSDAGQRAMVDAVKADSLRTDLNLSPVQGNQRFDQPKKRVYVQSDVFAKQGRAAVDLWNQFIGPGRN